MGWYFKAVLRQNFDYRLYPFDRQNVWIRFWHRDFSRNVVLVPLVESYTALHGRLRPGLEQDLVLPSFDVRATYFSFAFNTYNADFGIPRYEGRKNFPELHFHVAFRRKFINPFVRHLIPIFVMAIILFMVLAATTREPTKRDLFGFNLMNAVVSCAGVFFVAVYNHINLRSQLSSDSLIYLESFYFQIYLAILYITLTAFLEVSDIMFGVRGFFRLFKLKEDLFKLLYFPFFAGVAFPWSFIVFFP